MTFAEIMLWQELRGRRFNGFKFRRQHPIVYQQIEKRKYFYVADFYCASCKAVIELDGKVHEFSEQKQYDEVRNIVMNEWVTEYCDCKMRSYKKRTMYWSE